MILPTLVLVLAAALALGLGFEVWRLTSSKGVRLNTFPGALGLHAADRWSLSPAYDLNPVPEIDRAQTPKTCHL